MSTTVTFDKLKHYFQVIRTNSTPETLTHKDNGKTAACGHCHHQHHIFPPSQTQLHIHIHWSAGRKSSPVSPSTADLEAGNEEGVFISCYFKMYRSTVSVSRLRVARALSCNLALPLFDMSIWVSSLKKKSIQQMARLSRWKIIINQFDSSSVDCCIFFSGISYDH